MARRRKKVVKKIRRKRPKVYYKPKQIRLVTDGPVSINNLLCFKVLWKNGSEEAEWCPVTTLRGVPNFAEEFRKYEAHRAELLNVSGRLIKFDQRFVKRGKIVPSKLKDCEPISTIETPSGESMYLLSTMDRFVDQAKITVHAMYQHELPDSIVAKFNEKVLDPPPRKPDPEPKVKRGRRKKIEPSEQPKPVDPQPEDKETPEEDLSAHITIGKLQNEKIQFVYEKLKRINLNADELHNKVLERLADSQSAYILYKHVF